MNVGNFKRKSITFFFISETKNKMTGNKYVESRQQSKEWPY